MVRSGTLPYRLRVPLQKMRDRKLRDDPTPSVRTPPSLRAGLRIVAVGRALVTTEIKSRYSQVRTPTLDSSVVDTEMWDSRTVPNYNRLVLTSRVYERVDRTPLQHAAVLSSRLGNGNAVWIKREDLQPGFSFKIRGVVNKMSHIPAADLAKGVVTFTTGSHGECLARVASEFGTSATVVRAAYIMEVRVGWRRIKGGCCAGRSHGHAHMAAAENRGAGRARRASWRDAD